MMSKFPTTKSGEVGLRAIGARAVDAVAVLVVDACMGTLACSGFQAGLSSARTMVPWAIRARIVGTTACSDVATWGSVRPPRRA